MEPEDIWVPKGADLLPRMGGRSASPRRDPEGSPSPSGSSHIAVHGQRPPHGMSVGVLQGGPEFYPDFC